MIVFFCPVFGLCSPRHKLAFLFLVCHLCPRRHSQHAGEKRIDIQAHPYRPSTTAPTAGILLLRFPTMPNTLCTANQQPCACPCEKKADVPSTEVMIPTQGFSPGRFGRRTRSLGRGGRRGGASFVLPPLGGMITGSTNEAEMLSLTHRRVFFNAQSPCPRSNICRCRRVGIIDAKPLAARRAAQCLLFCRSRLLLHSPCRMTYCCIFDLIFLRLLMIAIEQILLLVH